MLSPHRNKSKDLSNQCRKQQHVDPWNTPQRNPKPSTRCKADRAERGVALHAFATSQQIERSEQPLLKTTTKATTTTFKSLEHT